MNFSDKCQAFFPLLDGVVAMTEVGQTHVSTNNDSGIKEGNSLGLGAMAA